MKISLITLTVMKKNPARNTFLIKEFSSNLEKINNSINIDQRLYKEDIEGSIAHCKMWIKSKIISSQNSIKSKKSIGGTSPKTVKRTI